MNKEQSEQGFFRRWATRKQRAEQHTATGFESSPGPGHPDSPQTPLAASSMPVSADSASAVSASPLSTSPEAAADAISASQQNRQAGSAEADITETGGAGSTEPGGTQTGAALGSETKSPEQAPDESPLLSDADMPAIESLTADSDVSIFFNRGVSAELKRAALRHVFMQPKFNVRDGLNDYDGDYTAFEPLGDTITCDMKWHTARKERARLELEAIEAEAAELSAAEAEETAAEETATKQVAEEETAAEEVAADELAVDEESIAATEQEETDGRCVSDTVVGRQGELE